GRRRAGRGGPGPLSEPKGRPTTGTARPADGRWGSRGASTSTPGVGGVTGAAHGCGDQGQEFVGQAGGQGQGADRGGGVVGTVAVGDHGAGLAGDEGSGSHVPGAVPQCEAGVQRAVGHQDQVSGGRPQTAQAFDPWGQLLIQGEGDEVALQGT